MRASKNDKPWGILFWVSIWQIAALMIHNRILLVSPVEVVGRIARLLVDQTFWHSIILSSFNIMSGFFIAMAGGLVLAAAASRIHLLYVIIEPLVKAMRSIPVASFIVLALILFSSKYLSVFVAFTVAFPIIFQSVFDGIAMKSEALHELTTVFRIPYLRGVRYLGFFEILPVLKTACKTTVGMSWKAGVAAELIGIPKSSIGEQLQQAKVYLETGELFAWTVVIILLSLVFDRLINGVLKGIQKILLF